MNTRHEEVKDRMSIYLSAIASDKNSLKTEGSRKALSERMRRDQVDLIVIQLDDEAIDDVRNPTLRRALRTLKQICG